MGIIELIFILAASFIVFLIVLLIIRLSSPRQSSGYINRYSNTNAFVQSNQQPVTFGNDTTGLKTTNNTTKGKFKYKGKIDDSAIKRNQKANEDAHKKAQKIHQDHMKRVQEQQRLQDTLNRQRQTRENNNRIMQENMRRQRKNW